MQFLLNLVYENGKLLDLYRDYLISAFGKQLLSDYRHC